LYSECITTVKNQGEIETLYREAYRILRPEGRRYGRVGLGYDNETRITYLKAWSIPADGKEYEVKDKDAIERGNLADYELYSDLREKVLLIPAADPGSVVGYEYVQKGRPFILQDQWYFQQEIPARHLRFTLQLPAGWEFDSYWENYPELKSRALDGNQFVWELNDVPGMTTEPRMPPWKEIAGRLVVTYVPPEDSAGSNARRSWKDLGVWYNGLVADRRQATPEIKKTVTEVTSGSTSPLDKMKALTSFMQRQIRYVAIEIGIGGWQPHLAGQIFTYKYGDCKDKVTLLSTMLHEAGIESYYVLINTERGSVRPEVPELDFNHVIVAIRLPQDVSADGLYAVIDHPKLGRLLFFDPTDPYTPLGYLPPFEQANHGLLMMPEGGELVALPLVAPKTNHLLRSATLHLAGDGTLSGSVEETRSGANASQWRAEFLESSEAERTKMLENYLSGNMARTEFTGAALQGLDKYDQNLGLSYKFLAQNYAKPAGNLLIFQPRVLGEESSSLLEVKERKYGSN
jgi:transglutaminase-like putative cysteine protease